MTTAMKANIPLFLMAIMVGNGANAGALSPFAPTGIIVNGLMPRIGMSGLEMEIYLSNLLAHALVAFGGYFLLGGWKLFTEHSAATVAPESAEASTARSKRRHWLTMAVIAVLITSVIFFGVHCRHGRVSCRRRAGAVERRRRPRGDQTDAVERHRDGQRRDGADRAARESSGHRPDRVDDREVVDRDSVTAVVAFLTGGISVYSSTSAVVLPAFLPMVPTLAEQLGGANPVAIAMSMNIGGHLVDVSPLSTIGALCLASVTGDESRRLFNQLLAWGLSMTIVGALLCYPGVRPERAASLAPGRVCRQWKYRSPLRLPGVR